MIYRRFVSTILAVCVGAGLLAGSAFAEEKKQQLTGLYGGAGFGVGITDDPSDTDYAWRMNVWWRPLDYASLEIGYIDAGHPGNGSEEVDGLHLVAVPTLPLPNGFDVYGKVGGFFWDDSNVAVGLGTAWHAGNAFNLSRDFGLRLDWDLLNADDNDSINVVTLGVFYRFAQ